ncbi:tyrosine protein kinase [Paenibacillus sp. JX-17]|uniref:Tyrosine protein kinase n=1 Tax=Paenibacillus lacisoli TaxID=3064525 RepID=A0ABT9CE53_9BACL|nr:tyrosine protein kinase [Paenibacillus sp. JX-17]MDO7907559.1 tyrosine protein kinase [Paenibacillus sp. JX-17]
MSQHYYNRGPRHQRSIAEPYTTTPSSYPGLDAYLDAPPQAEASSFLPFNPVESTTAVTPAAAPAKSGGGLLGGLGNLGNLGDLKGIIDRMGGIDGMLATLTKVQKVMGSIQQIAPMAKLIMGALPFGSKGSTKGSDADSTDYEEYTPPRRRKKKKSAARKNSSSSRRKPKKRKRTSAAR